MFSADFNQPDCAIITLISVILVGEVVRTRTRQPVMLIRCGSLLKGVDPIGHEIIQVETMRLSSSTVLALLILFTIACSDSGGWQQALESTAPPDPNKAVVGKRQRESQRQPERQIPQTDMGEATRRTQTQQTEQPSTVTLQVSLSNYPNCHVGAVRFYINRKYIGQFNEQGLLEVEVNPGALTLEVWDSGGHWIRTVNVSSGQSIEIEFSCSEKELFGQSDGPAVG